MSRSDEIAALLNTGLSPDHLEVINESHGHNVPQGSETHFKVVIVGKTFQDISKVQRHRQVYGLLAPLMADGVHALAIHAYTPAEWSAREQAPLSPPCLGGGKRNQ